MSEQRRIDRKDSAGYESTYAEPTSDMQLNAKLDQYKKYVNKVSNPKSHVSYTKYI